jgi:hypothetical protein
LAGRRKCYPSNLAKCLGLVPPDSLARPSSEQVQAYLNDMRALLKHPNSTQYSYSTKCEQGQRQLPDMLFNLF